MNLAKLFETQRLLDEHILDEHPELKGQNNLDWKVLALQVELGECANEWRGFKKWSNDQKPRRWKHDDACPSCDGKGVILDRGAMDFWECEECKGTGEVENEGDPLLEEYVDCLHFILSIGLELIIQNRYADEVNFNIGSRTKRISADQCFKDMFIKVALVSALPIDEEYMELLSTFVTLGDSLGFDENQVELAYFKKNAINHERQANGY